MPKKRECVICLKDWGVCALQAGATMLVRPMNPQPSAGIRLSAFFESGYEDGHGREITCPFGSPGGTLLCKEAYAIESGCVHEPMPHNDGRPVRKSDMDGDDCERWWQAHYRATDPMPALMCEHEDCAGDPCSHPWRSARTMPRWAVRHKLTVVSVRAVSLLEITELEAAATGMYRIGSEWVAPGVMMTCVDGTTAIDWPCHYSALGAFKSRWDDDWDKRGLGWWEKPWVWLCEVKV